MSNKIRNQSRPFSFAGKGGEGQWRRALKRRDRQVFITRMQRPDDVVGVHAAKQFVRRGLMANSVQ